MGKNHMNFIFKTLGFIVGFGLAFFIEFGVFEIFHELFNRRIRPGIGALIIPFMGGYLIATVTSYESIKNFINEKKMGRRVRLVLAGGGSWMSLVAGYVFLAEPFGSYINNSEWRSIFAWLIIPPVIFVAIFAAFSWATKTPD
jgi:hypothetical protein